MIPNDQGKQKNRQRGALILRVGIVFLLVVGLTIWLQRISRPASSNPSSPATIQINLPTVEYPTIPPSAPEFTVSLQSIGNSGVSGKVTFKDIAGTVAILLHVDGLSE